MAEHRPLSLEKGQIMLTPFSLWIVLDISKDRELAKARIILGQNAGQYFDVTYDEPTFGISILASKQPRKAIIFAFEHRP